MELFIFGDAHFFIEAEKREEITHTHTTTTVVEHGVDGWQKQVSAHQIT